MHNFLVCAYKSQDFAQNLKNFARSHDRETVTFRNSGLKLWGKFHEHIGGVAPCFYSRYPKQS